MTSEVARCDSRNREILRNAIDAFGSYGVRGASLRDIARRAGVSLTLIHHHFGNKPSLVWATTNAMLKASADPLRQLKREVCGTDVSLDGLVEAWMRYLIDAFGTESKIVNLRLLHRLRGDPDVEESTRASLDASEPVIRDALRRLYPAASRTSVDLVLRCARAALLSAFLGDGQTASGRAGTPWLDNQDRVLVEKFVVAAVVATLAAHEQDPLGFITDGAQPVAG